MIAANAKVSIDDTYEAAYGKRGSAQCRKAAIREKYSGE
jgi:hypothetical protein